MAKIIRVVSGLVVAGAVVLMAAGWLGLLQGSEPKDLGVRDGRLKPPSTTDNSVSSQAELYPENPQAQAAAIAPLALIEGDGDGTATLARVRNRAAQMPGAEVVSVTRDYLYVRFKTRWLGFVDDAEFWFDPEARVIHVRSASRIGQRDFGFNRERIEQLREALALPER